MTCNTPKKDDSAGKCCGRGCHGKDDFRDASTAKPDPAPQTPPEAPKDSGCCKPANDTPCCKP